MQTPILDDLVPSSTEQKIPARPWIGTTCDCISADAGCDHCPVGWCTTKRYFTSMILGVAGMRRRIGLVNTTSPRR